LRETKCDICGRVECERAPLDWATIAVPAPPPHYRREVDVCPECTGILGRILTQLRNERRQLGP